MSFVSSVWFRAQVLKDASERARLDKLVKSQEFHSCIQEFEPAKKKKKNAALAKLVRRHFLKVKTRWFEPNMQYKCGSSSVG